MRWALPRNERGTVTAEFAVLMPALLAIVLLTVTAIMLAAHRVVLVSAAAEIARLEARGDDASAEARYRALDGAVELQRHRTDELHCVELRARPASGLLAAVTVSARGCAAGAP